MKSLYIQIQEKLLNVSSTKAEGHAYKRIKRLSGLVTGMIETGNSSMVNIGSGIAEDINADSKTTAAKRFISNKWTDYPTHFLPFLIPFIRGIISLMSINETLKLVIDGSQTGKNHATLMISVVWRNRGIPICWFVKKGKKGHFKESDHVHLLQQAYDILSPLIPTVMSVVVLGDGEFDGIDVQTFCNDCTWSYVLRTACNTILYENEEEFQAKEIEPILEQDCFFIPDVEFTRKRFKYVNFLCWHNKKRHDDPIFLVSSLSEVGDIMTYYDLRYSIECLFKDFKSNGFNLSQTRLKNAHDISNLIIVAALAFIILITLAINNDNPPMRKKAQRVRKDRKVLGFFLFAYRLLKYFVKYRKSLNFSFQFSKNLE